MDYHTKKSIRYEATKDINYKDDSGSDDKNDDNKDNISEYVPSVVSAKPSGNVAKAHGVTTAQTTQDFILDKYKPSWQQVADNVVLCGRTSLHCQNMGNVMLREYVFAAVLLHFKFQHDIKYNKEYSVAELFETFEYYEWMKLGNENEMLSNIEVKIKIRKAFNDRRKKYQQMLDKDSSGLSTAGADRLRLELVQTLEKKVKVQLKYFEAFDYEPLSTKPTHIPQLRSSSSKSGTHDNHLTELSFDNFSDDTSVKSDLTDKSWISQRKALVKKGTKDLLNKGRSDINSLLEKASKRRKTYEGKSWQWDKSDELVDEDSTVDGVYNRNPNQQKKNKERNETNVALTLSKKRTEKAIVYEKDKSDELDDENSTVDGVFNGDTNPQMWNNETTDTNVGLSRSKKTTTKGKLNEKETKKQASIESFVASKVIGGETFVPTSILGNDKDEVTKGTKRSIRREKSDKRVRGSVQWSREVNRHTKPPVTINSDYAPESTMSASTLDVRSTVFGTPVNARSPTLKKFNSDGKDILSLSMYDVGPIVNMDDMMEEVTTLFEKLLPSDVDVADLEETEQRYFEGKKSFSILAPCRERTKLKISHGSHRFKYVEPDNENEMQMIHRALISEISIPENCMLILDENLIHAGTETMTCGYSPVHSPPDTLLTFIIKTDLRREM